MLNPTRNDHERDGALLPAGPTGGRRPGGRPTGRWRGVRDGDAPFGTRAPFAVPPHRALVRLPPPFPGLSAAEPGSFPGHRGPPDSDGPWAGGRGALPLGRASPARGPRRGGMLPPRRGGGAPPSVSARLAQRPG